MKRIFKSKLLLLLNGLLILAVLVVPFVVNSMRSHQAHAIAPELPAGFAKTQLAHGLKNPSVLAFAPNGDIYIGEQAGTVLIYRNGAIVSPAVITLNADGAAEKGLLGLTLDPNFATNGYMYVSYTTLDEHAQLSRLTVQNGIANPASEVVYMKGNQLQNPHHSANDLHIGPDGKLWWAVGDNVPSITNGETLTNIYGKILRFNLDGTIPSDNPFLKVPGAVPAIYAYGLRNPFRFTFLPNGKAMTIDTGSSFWEELNTIQPGGNFGWDFYEGNCGSCGYINPAYAYGHLPTDGASSAIADYSGSVFPKQYNQVVFFGDYNRQDIEAVTFDPTYSTEISETVFDNSAGTIADLQEGPDGNLYYVSIFEGTFSKISAVGPFSPVAAASASPNAGLSSLAVQFSSAGSSEPYGLPLSYSWDFGDGSPVSTDANPSHSYTTNGTYTATLTVSRGTQTATASTTVVVGNTPPTASITSPAVNATYNGGDTISFSGTATDAVDGTLPASAYTWQADFYSNGVAQPFYTAEVAHPFYGPVTGVTNGSFQIPQDLSNSASTFYRISMTAVDSLGIQTVVTRDIHPNQTNWSVNTNIPGGAYVVDGTWHTTPYTTQDGV
jgi:glucose/arabinose dehydrogenase